MRAHDPDIGQRLMKYDDRNFLVRHKNGAGDVLAFFYDDAGRLTARGPRSDFVAPVLTYTPDARDYRYSYDSRAAEAANCPGQGYTQGRLAAVEEPVGGAPGVGRVAMCYDSLGRQQGLWRSIGSKKAWQWRSLAASGLPLTEQADDGFKVFSDYDGAGRLVMLSDATTGGVKNKPIWSATPDSAAAQAMDAAGRVMTETYGQNIVAQNYLRDALGLPSGIQVGRLGTSPTLLYQVAITARTPYGAPQTVVDAIAGGVDHNATYAYDGAARLTNAILGQGTAAWKFRFEYDGLQNMIGRTQAVPAGKGWLAIQSGIYRYGENGFGPRQLTSVAHDCDDLLNTYEYDGAGRMHKDGKRTLAYDGYDQLTSVTDNGAALVSHAYGYDGLRTYTKGAGNAEQYWFTSDDTLQPGGTTRWHYVKVGDRLVARQSFSHPSSTVAFPPAGATVAWWPRIEARAPRYFVTTTATAALLLLAWAGWRRRRPLWQTAPAVVCSVAMVLATPACDDVESRQQGVEDASARRYFHQGVAAGPTLITDGGGSAIDERRFEPFGQPIDANMALDPYNSLNKERNAETGWSYHGARWMAPQTARWLTPDPAVKGPRRGVMAQPWALNPYAYADQSPTMNWDPNGQETTIIYGGIKGVVRPHAMTEASWRNTIGETVRQKLEGYWNRQFKQHAGEYEGKTPKNPFTGEKMNVAVPNIMLTPPPDLFAEATGSDTVVLFGHVETTRAKETGAVLSTDIRIYVNASLSVRMRPEDIVVPEGVKSLYVVGCGSSPFAERLAGLHPGMKVYGTPIDKRVNESSVGGSTAAYDIFQYPANTEPAQVKSSAEDLQFNEFETSQPEISPESM